VSQLNELKIDNASLSMIAGWLHNGNVIMVEQMPIFGGYIGGIEETAICDIATTLTSFTMLNASYHLDGPIHIRWGTTTSRETLQIAGHVAAALDHTDLLLANQYYPISGPCTEMCLTEIATQALLDTASGRELVSGSASAKGVLEDCTTGMEARMLGEVATAAAGMDVEQVNDIIHRLIRRYERRFLTAPAGRTFQECYNVRRVTPTKEYLKVYETVVEMLRKQGIDMP
jgi:methylamine--corrinoid protein Co-methyltransferase